MKKLFILITTTCLFVLNAYAQKTYFKYGTSSVVIDEVKITESITLYKTGSTNAYPNMIALKTENGVVIFDTHAIPEVAKQIREMAEKKYKKSVVLVINTHAWYDHTNGNIMFKDVPIIGHDNTTKELVLQNKIVQDTSQMKLRIAIMKNFKSSYTGNKTEVDEAIEIQSAMNEIRKNGTTAPTFRFNDKMTITLGKTTLHLFYNTPSYSGSDIIIEIPEEHTLVLGDIFNKDRLPWLDQKTDYNAMNNLFSPFLSDSTKITNFIGTHGYLMEKSEVKEQLDYVNKLHESVIGLKMAGKTFLEIEKELDIKTFKYLNNYNPIFNGTGLDLHKLNIRAIYTSVKME